MALVIAWAFEVTPQGIKRTDEMEDLPDSRARRSNVWIYVVIAAGILSIVVFYIGRYSARSAVPQTGYPVSVAQPPKLDT